MMGTPASVFRGTTNRSNGFVDLPTIDDSMITPMNSNAISNQGISPIDMENDKKRAKKVESSEVSGPRRFASRVRGFGLESERETCVGTSLCDRNI